MKTVVVTDQNQKWFEIPDATVLTGRRYLAEPESGNEGTVRVLNLCRDRREPSRRQHMPPGPDRPRALRAAELVSRSVVIDDPALQPATYGCPRQRITAKRQPSQCVGTQRI